MKDNIHLMDIIVIGGSLGGLNAALWLRELGCNVRVFERAEKPLIGLGAGIVLNPATVRYLAQQPQFDVNALSVSTQALCYLGTDGAVITEQYVGYRFSSYNALYRGMLDAFGLTQYQLGHRVTHFEQDTNGVTVHLSNSHTTRCDLLVCADGIRSVGRQVLLGEDAKPSYAGYVAWRGIVKPSDIAPERYALMRNAITYHLLPNSHMLTYPIPVVDQVDITIDTPFINWLWYRNVAEGDTLNHLMTDKDNVRRDLSVGAGAVAHTHVNQLRHEAAALLPPPLNDLIQTTAQPFVQMIVDYAPPHLAFGRVCLIGDAAYVARPHAAAGSAKACEDGYQLALALQANDFDISVALSRWENHQRQIGEALLQRTRAAGDRSQFSNTWRLGDALPFGLYQIGDSEMREA